MLFYKTLKMFFKYYQTLILTLKTIWSVFKHYQIGSKSNLINLNGIWTLMKWDWVELCVVYLKLEVGFRSSCNMIILNVQLIFFFI